MGPSNYHASNPKRVNWKRWAGVVAVGVVIGVAVMPLIPTSNHSGRGMANRAICARRLHQIGLAISLYADRHGGEYPDSFETVLRDGPVTADFFVCPESNDEPASGPTTEATVAELERPGHVSYVYLGIGLNEKTVKPGQAIAYDKPGNHDDGMNVLFGDGHAEWMTTAAASKVIPGPGPATRPGVAAESGSL